MNIKSLCAAVALAAATAAPATAAPINLDFSFPGASGTFYGLDDAVAGIQAASGFDFVASLGSYSGLNTTSPADINRFEFTSGNLSTVSYLNLNVISGVGSTSELVYFELGSGFFGVQALAFEFGEGGSNTAPFGDVTFTATPVSAVPLPAGALLLLTGLAGVAGLKRRKKRAA